MDYIAPFACARYIKPPRTFQDQYMLKEPTQERAICSPVSTQGTNGKSKIEKPATILAWAGCEKRRGLMHEVGSFRNIVRFLS